MDLEALYARHIDAIELAVRLTCRHWHVGGSDAEELAAELRLGVLDRDGRVLLAFAGRSGIGTYLFKVMNRVAAGTSIDEV